MRADPPPTVNSVPEPQPPPNCMPKPKISEPMTTDRPTGPVMPTSGWPPRLPAASSGIMTIAVTPIISIWARMPRPRFSTTMRRQPPVKPNEP